MGREDSPNEWLLPLTKTPPVTCAAGRGRFCCSGQLVKNSRSSRRGSLITLVLIALGMRWECWIFRPQPAQATGFAIPAESRPQRPARAQSQSALSIVTQPTGHPWRCLLMPSYAPRWFAAITAKASVEGPAKNERCPPLHQEHQSL